MSMVAYRYSNALGDVADEMSRLVGARDDARRERLISEARMAVLRLAADIDVMDVTGVFVEGQDHAVALALSFVMGGSSTDGTRITLESGYSVVQRAARML